MKNVSNRRGFGVSSGGVLCLIVAAFLLGCGDDSNRVVSPAESQAADVKRQAFIDNNPNLTPEQKAIMKSHMGGPPPPAGPTGRR